MTSHRPDPAVYKEITYSQLRSFSETARLGTMTAAAKSLQLSHPTVWKQIRALEDRLGQTLLEVRGRRCVLTPAGQSLFELALGVVNELESLPERFQQNYAAVAAKLVVAATTRVCVEDLPRLIPEFHQRCPQVRLVIRELFENQGVPLLEQGEIDILLEERLPSAMRVNFHSEACFEIEPIVVMPLNHPLAKRRKLEPSDLAKYPILNRADGYPDEEICEALRRAGAYQHPDRVFDLKAATSIRQCVRLGYGIGIVGRVGGGQTDTGLVEISLSPKFRSTRIYAYSRRTITRRSAHQEFIELVRSRLGPTLSADDH